MDISSNSITSASLQPVNTSEDKQVEPQSEGMQVSKAERQSRFEDWEPLYKVMMDTNIGIISSSDRMRQLYTGVQNDLLNEAPGLLAKDWDFSVDEAGEIVIIEGQNKLTESEINKLKGVLEDNGIDDAMNMLADNVIGNLAASRGPEGFAEEDSLGRFDVNKENFKDIIRGRELMLGMQISKDTRLTDGQTAHYNQKSGAPGLNRHQQQLRAMETYNEGKQAASDLIVSQIMMRAVAKF